MQAWMMQIALDFGLCYEQSSSSVFVRDDGEPQIVANSLTTSFALNLIGPCPTNKSKARSQCATFLMSPSSCTRPRPRKSWTIRIRFNSSDGSCPLEIVWFPRFMTMQRKDVIEVTRYVLVAADGVKRRNPSNCRGPSSRVARCPKAMRSERPRW